MPNNYAKIKKVVKYLGKDVTYIAYRHDDCILFHKMGTKINTLSKESLLTIWTLASKVIRCTAEHMRRDYEHQHEDEVLYHPSD